jgi:AraC-like DNA-binding protein
MRSQKIICKTDIEKMREVTEYIDRNYRDQITIGVLCSIVSLSRSTLQRHFFACYKLSVYDYIRKCRMEKAKELLSLHEFSIRDIGIQAGYNARSAFTHAFTKYAGMSPIQFSKKYPLILI